MKKQASIFFYGVVSAGIGVLCASKLAKKQIYRIQLVSDKHLTLYMMLYQWIKVKQDGKEIASYLNKFGYKNIAIYGMSYVAELLIKELEHSDIQIMYGIDKKISGSFYNIDVRAVDEPLEKVDAIIVTAVSFFEDIEKQLKNKIKCPIISLEDIIFGLQDDSKYC